MWLRIGFALQWFSIIGSVVFVLSVIGRLPA